MTWHNEAACAGAPQPERFDRPLRSRPSKADADADAAEAIIAEFCKGCPVIDACLRDALATNATGIRGGRLLVHEHGSITAYNNHKKRGEKACAPCLEAAAAYTADRRQPLTISRRRELDIDWMIANSYARAVSL